MTKRIESSVLKIIEGLSKDQRGVIFLCPRDDFIKLGHIDSLSIIRLVCSLEEAFSVEIPMDKVASCDFRTARGVAKVIKELQHVTP